MDKKHPAQKRPQERGEYMKLRNFEVITGLAISAAGGAILQKGVSTTAGMITLAFALVWSIGYFTNVFYEDEGGAEIDNSNKDTRLSVTRRKSA